MGKLGLNSSGYSSSYCPHPLAYPSVSTVQPLAEKGGYKGQDRPGEFQERGFERGQATTNIKVSESYNRRRTDILLPYSDSGFRGVAEVYFVHKTCLRVLFMFHLVQ